MCVCVDLCVCACVSVSVCVSGFMCMNLCVWNMCIYIFARRSGKGKGCVYATDDVSNTNDGGGGDDDGGGGGGDNAAGDDSISDGGVDTSGRS